MERWRRWGWVEMFSHILVCRHAGRQRKWCLICPQGLYKGKVIFLPQANGGDAGTGSKASVRAQRRSFN